MNNPTLDSIFNRSSIRAYTAEPLTEDELKTLEQVALATPTAMNLQSQRYYFVTDKELIRDIELAVGEVIREGDEQMYKNFTERGGKVMYDAPLFVAVAIDQSGRFSKVDAGIAVGALATAAQSMGLSSVILGMPRMAFEGARGAELSARLGIPEGLAFEIGIAIGHAAMEKAPHESDPEHVKRVG